MSRAKWQPQPQFERLLLLRIPDPASAWGPTDDCAHCFHLNSREFYYGCIVGFPIYFPTFPWPYLSLLDDEFLRFAYLVVLYLLLLHLSSVSVFLPAHVHAAAPAHCYPRSCPAQLSCGRVPVVLPLSVALSLSATWGCLCPQMMPLRPRAHICEAATLGENKSKYLQMSSWH